MHDEARGTLVEEPQYEDVLHHLTRYGHDEGVLSLYLDIDPATAGREGYEAQLIELWKSVRAHEHTPWLAGRLEYEIEHMTDVVRSWRQPPGRAVAMFFSGPGGVRVVLPLQFPVRPLARFEPRPVLGPLIAALDEHRRFCVILFDRAGARLITVSLGRVEEEVTLTSDVPAKTDVGGWGGYLQGRYARHREHHLIEHARRTVERIWAIDRAHPLHAIILSGPEESLAVLRRMLPRALDRTVAGVVPGEMFASTSDIVRHVGELEAGSREREDRELLERTMDDARAGGTGAAGWDETLQALGEGRVQVLILAPGNTVGGVECPAGHFSVVSPVETCPICDARTEHVDDVAEAAIRVAMHTDARVHYLAPAAASLMMQQGAGAAAVLRY